MKCVLYIKMFSKSLREIGLSILFQSTGLTPGSDFKTVETTKKM